VDGRLSLSEIEELKKKNINAKDFAFSEEQMLGII